jgi:transaldolase
MGVKVLATAIYTTEQGVLAALAGADYLAPYVNRMENYGNGIQKIEDLVAILKLQNIDSIVIAASFKNINQVNSVLKAGVSALTLPANIINEMINNSHTISAVEQFVNNWRTQYNTEQI